MSCGDGGSASIRPLKLSPQNSRSTWSMMLTLTTPAAPSAPCEPESEAAGSRPGGENACGFAMVPVSIGGQSPTLRQVASSGGRCRETVDEAGSIRGSVQWCGDNEFLSAAHRNARMFLRDSVTLSSKGMGIFAQGGRFRCVCGRWQNTPPSEKQPPARFTAQFLYPFTVKCKEKWIADWTKYESK
jgi:hypothetical protein